MKKSLVKITLLGAAFALFLFSACSHSSDSDNESENFLDFEWTGDQNYKSPTKLPELSNQSENLEENWWRNSVFYHIWIKSFKDSDLDDCSRNCGDFKGIEDSLDYIKNDLGCDAIWLSPFYECDYKESTNAASAQMNMHGYDVVNYYKVNSYFGTGNGSNAEAELDSLIKACHEKGIKIIFDFIPNHTAASNQWFQDSINKKNGKRSWYLWNDTPLNGTNNYGGNPWHREPDNSLFPDSNPNKKYSYYYATFTDNMPDLNYRNWEVREEMKNVARYWLNKGFDGLRVDGARHLIENATSSVDTPETHAWFAELREVIDEYKSPKFMVCESWIDGNRAATESYFGTDEKPEFHMVFDFDQGKPMAAAAYIEDTLLIHDGKNYNLAECIRANPSSSKTYGIFLCNHDTYYPRLGSVYGEGTSTGAILATSLYLLAPSVPFIYYGNEVGQALGNFDGDPAWRQPLKWNLVNEQKKDENSLLNINKKLIALRNSPEYRDLFANGKIQMLKCDMTITGTNKPWTGAVQYIISNESKKLLVSVNLRNNKERCLWFEDFGVEDVENYSLLIGNKETYNSFDYADGDFKTYDYAPYEIRVYDLTSADKECILDIWDYDFNSLYMRGTFNDWEPTAQMSYNEESQEFSISLTVEEKKSDETENTEEEEKEEAAVVAGKIIEFKLDECGDWAHSLGPVSAKKSVLTLNTPLELTDKTGLETNLQFTPEEAGTYLFTYKNADRTITVSKVE